LLLAKYLLSAAIYKLQVKFVFSLTVNLFLVSAVLPDIAGKYYQIEDKKYAR